MKVLRHIIRLTGRLVVVVNVDTRGPFSRTGDLRYVPHNGPEHRSRKIKLNPDVEALQLVGF